jgi:gliding motility-associated-like protein
MGKNQNSYLDHRLSLQHSLAGCYYVTALDSYDNESLHSNYICVENCPRYELPNVFTPNGDGFNDEFGPMNGYRFVENIDLKVYNRWGQQVFSTSDPAINWDGKDEFNHMPLPDGTYYFNCIVREIYFDGLHDRTLNGIVVIMRNGK